VKNLSLSKNKDKIIRQSSAKKVIKIHPDNLKGLENRLHQTNNLMFYKSKMKSLLNVDEYRKDTNIHLLQMKSIDKKIQHIQGIHEVDDIVKLNKKLEVKVKNEIDLMIEKLEKN